MLSLSPSQISALKLLGFTLDLRSYGAVIHKDHWTYVSYFTATNKWEKAWGLPSENAPILEQVITILGPHNVE